MHQPPIKLREHGSPLSQLQQRLHGREERRERVSEPQLRQPRRSLPIVQVGSARSPERAERTVLGVHHVLV